MSAVPLELQALVKGHDPDRPEDVVTVRDRRPGPHPRRGAVRAGRPRRPARRPRGRGGGPDADWAVLGPGSRSSSAIPHLLVPELLDALTETKARRVLSLNLAPQPGETEGFSPQRHLEVLGRHAPKLALDVVLADEAAVPDRDSLTDAAQRVRRRGRAGAGGPDQRTPAGRPGAVRPPRTTVFFGCMEGSAHGDDGSGEDEISRLPVTGTACRKAEVSAILRFAVGLHLVSGRIVIEAELDTAYGGAPAEAGDFLEIFGHSSELIRRDGARPALRRGSRYVVRVVAGGDQLARQTGSWTAVGARSGASRRRWSRGHLLTPRRPGAGRSWRTARSPSRACSSSLEVTCPGPGGRARARRRRPSALDRREGPRGARRGPRGRP